VPGAAITSALILNYLVIHGKCSVVIQEVRMQTVRKRMILNVVNSFRKVRVCSTVIAQK